MISNHEKISFDKKYTHKKRFFNNDKYAHENSIF